MAQRLRVPSVFTEDLGLVPGIHTGQLTMEAVTPAPRDLMPFLASADRHMHAHGTYSYTQAHTQTHKQISKDQVHGALC